MRHAALTLAVATICAASLFAQSPLGELARKEEQRRKAVPAKGKVYTNDDLKPSPASAPSAPADTAAAAPSPAQAQAPAAQPGAPAPAADSARKDEAYWRSRLQAERDGIERAKVLLDALQGRVNGLQTDFVNRDDPAARAIISAERQRAVAELDKTKLEIQQRTKAIADIQEEARKAGAPAGWYR